MDRAEAFISLHQAWSSRTTSALDLSDLIRASLVMGVSAMDQFIHELTREGMLEIFAGTRSSTDAYSKFGFPLGQVGALASARPGRTALDLEIRQRHGYLTFQQPDKIADAIRIISGKKLWAEVAHALGTTPELLKAQLSLIVERRNKIAHEADIDPSYPGQRWPIAPGDATDACQLIRQVCEAVYDVVTTP